MVVETIIGTPIHFPDLVWLRTNPLGRPQIQFPKKYILCDGQINSWDSNKLFIPSLVENNSFGASPDRIFQNIFWHYEAYPICTKTFPEKFAKTIQLECLIPLSQGGTIFI